MGTSMEREIIRVLLAKVGLDAHDRGVLVLSSMLRNAGMEVIYLGMFQMPEAVVKAAIEEGCSVICLSDHSGMMKLIGAEVIEYLKKYAADDIVVVAGGVIPDEDVVYLESIGVTGNFCAGSSWEAIINHIETEVKKNEN